MKGLRLFLTGIVAVIMLPLFVIAICYDFVICLVVLGLDLTTKHSPDDLCMINALGRLLKKIAGEND
jgi:hypothetical protein